MSILSFIFLFALFCPILTALSAAILLYLAKRKVPGFNRLAFPMYAYFLATGLFWSCMVFFFFRPDLNPYSLPVAFLSLMLIPLFLYHFIYNITQGDSSRPFPIYHYMVPLAVFILVTAWGDIQELGAVCRFVLNVVYGVLAILRQRKYHRNVDENIYKDRMYSFSWMNLLVLLSLVVMLITLVSTFFDFTRLSSSLRIFMAITALLITFQQYLLLVYSYRLNLNFLREVKDLSDEFDQIGTDDELDEEQIEYSGFVDKALFEELLVERKMYLNPYLKMTDLLTPLQTNRDYLSRFVNQTYRMNFKSYLNSLRLQEYKRLQSDPSNKKYNIQELIFQAGFANYRQYLRAKSFDYSQEEEMEDIISPD